MKVLVDRSKCTSLGNCEDVPEEERELIEKAIAACPTAALSLVEDRAMTPGHVVVGGCLTGLRALEAARRAHAMRNLLDPDSATPYRHILSFWSDWYGHRIQLAELPLGSPLSSPANPGQDMFTALFRDGDRSVGALTLNRRADIMKYRALIPRRASPDGRLELARAHNALAVKA